VFIILLVNDVKHIRALLRMDQLSERKFSVARIIAGVMKFPISCLRRES